MVEWINLNHWFLGKRIFLVADASSFFEAVKKSLTTRPSKTKLRLLIETNWNFFLEKLKEINHRGVLKHFSVFKIQTSLKWFIFWTWIQIYGKEHSWTKLTHEITYFLLRNAFYRTALVWCLKVLRIGLFIN